MRTHSIGLFTCCILALIVMVPTARAQWAVVDAPAILQLIQEVQTMQQQLATARQQLQSAQQALTAMTGDRGMEQLLGNTVRNYLPSNWTDVTNAALGRGASGYAGLVADVQRIVAANAVLSPQGLAALSSADQQQIQRARQSIATQQALASEALANSSGRFAAIQGLISAIATATDAKAVLDLQARIGAEVGMLQNEQTKLQILFQGLQAQAMSVQQQARERAIDGQGRFETRFRPTP